jgi:uncharacterized membrane protein (DUF373 family)
MKGNEILKKYESLILILLAAMMMVVVFFATVDLGWLLLKYLFAPPLGLIQIDELLDVFGMFLLVLIGIELLDTISTYRRDQVIRVEIAIIVALLAISRKVIILDYKNLTSFNLLDVGVVVLALAAAYYLLRVGRRSRLRDPDSVPGASKDS